MQKLIYTFTQPEYPINCVKFNPDEMALAA